MNVTGWCVWLVAGFWTWEFVQVEELKRQRGTTWRHGYRYFTKPVAPAANVNTPINPSQLSVSKKRSTNSFAHAEINCWMCFFGGWFFVVRIKSNICYHRVWSSNQYVLLESHFLVAFQEGSHPYFWIAFTQAAEVQSHLDSCSFHCWSVSVHPLQRMTRSNLSSATQPLPGLKLYQLELPISWSVSV